MRQFLLCVLLLSPLGCSNNRSVMERELAEMRQKIAILQSERERLEQRLQLLESRASPPAGSAPAASELAWQRPSLDVVRLTPSTARPATEPVEADANERYLIYGSGDALHVRELPAEAGGDEATVGQGETP